MTLSITVSLLHGTIRIGSPDHTMLAGGDPVGEWPPSPARLFSALVAGDGTGDRCTYTSGGELSWLESLDPPDIHASPPSEVEQSAMCSRYAVVDDTAVGTNQNYPARATKEVRPGIRLSPQQPAITYAWPDATPSESHLNALRYRAARIGYLGCADSPVQVTVGDRGPEDSSKLWKPDRSSPTTLPVPYPGFLNALDRSYAQWSVGEATARAWIRTRRVGYRIVGERHPIIQTNRDVVWLRFGESLSGRDLLLVTKTLRSAITDHLQRLLGEGEVPAVVHGHRPNSVEGSQANFIALLDAGFRFSSGRIYGAAIALPRDVDSNLHEQITEAAFSLARQGLFVPHHPKLNVSVFGGEAKPWASNPRRWTRRSRRWVSVTPVVHEHWSNHGPDSKAVARWCHHAGIAAGAGGEDLVSSVQTTRHPLVSGALDVPPVLVFRVGHERRPYSHMRVTFARPVEGLLVLGRGRQLGFGLFAPEDKETDIDG